MSNARTDQPALTLSTQSLDQQLHDSPLILFLKKSNVDKATKQKNSDHPSSYIPVKLALSSEIVQHVHINRPNTRTNRHTRDQKKVPAALSPPTQAMPRKLHPPALHPQTGSRCLQLAYLPGPQSGFAAPLRPNRPKDAIAKKDRNRWRKLEETGDTIGASTATIARCLLLLGISRYSSTSTC